jgi:hemerythrin-like domain-containing protein
LDILAEAHRQGNDQMLTERITRRFVKHHARVLAYMDAAEALAQQLATSVEPRADFEESREQVEDFLDFMAVEEIQHEKEEEQVLLPVLSQQIDEAGKVQPRMSMERMCREHAVGRRLIKELEQRLTQFDQEKAASRDHKHYYVFSEALHDVVWHFRRHISLEDSIILPTTEQLIPDSADELWAKSNPKPECPDA